MSPPVIRSRDLSKRLGGRWVLSRLSFEVASGQAVLLTGENGAGKTTLLKLLATLARPSYGELALFGQPTSSGVDTLRPRLGLFTHATHLYDLESGRANLAFVARATGKSASDVEAALQRVGLATDAARPVRAYSAGMKRRLMLARLFLKRPELILLDEPWSALDAGAVELMSDAVRDFKRAGATLVIATHDKERALPLCDAHLELTQGRTPGVVAVPA